MIHMAARPGVRASLETPSLYVDNNVGGTQVLLDAMRERGLKNLVFASSSSVYGARSEGPFSEEDLTLQPVSPYAATKLAGEHLCHAASTTWGMSISCMRLFTVYGPRQRPEMAIHLFSRLALAGQSIPRFGSGSSLRDYTYVSDVVEGLIAASTRLNGFRIYNLGNDQPIELDALIAKLQDSVADLVGLLDTHCKSMEAECEHMRDAVLPKMLEVREAVDTLEGYVPTDVWPLPTYQDMLFIK